MTRYFLLGVALISLSTAAHASTGTIRFSGRIVDPSCNASLIESQHLLRIEACPLAAQGAEISVTSKSTGAASAGNGVLVKYALHATAPEPSARIFSQRYQLDMLQHHAAGSRYLVVVNYP